MSTLKSILTAMIATGLVAGAAFAASNTITVNLPQAINVGDATLASGQYTVTESNLADGTSLFVFRNDKGDATAATAMKSANPTVDQKTEVILSNEGGKMHLDKMFIEGDSAGYQFSK
jgi:uncharacterized cupredoxin-like copper-binding protein